MINPKLKTIGLYQFICDFENIRKCNAQPIDGIFHIT